VGEREGGEGGREGGREGRRTFGENLRPFRKDEIIEKACSYRNHLLLFNLAFLSLLTLPLTPTHQQSIPYATLFQELGHVRETEDRII